MTMIEPLLRIPMQHMFQLPIPFVEKLLRPIIVYLALVLLLRVFGKRELAQLNPFDLVVLLSLSNTVQNALIGDDNSITGGLLGAFTLLSINWLTVRFLFSSQRLDKVLSGEQRLLILDGQLDHVALKKELLTEEELLSVVHKQGFDSFEEVQKCVLEPNGSFYVEGRKPSSDVARHSELMARLEALSSEIKALKAQLPAR